MDTKQKFYSDLKYRKLMSSELGRIDADRYADAGDSGIVVVLDNVRSAHNVGSAFRTADCFHCDKIMLCGICAVPPSALIHKTALGAEQNVPWEYFHDTLQAVTRLREEGFRIVGVEQTENSLELGDFRRSASEKVAFVFGNEVDGVDQSVLESCDAVVEIPQYGAKHSLNVSVSVGIILWQNHLKY